MKRPASIDTRLPGEMLFSPNFTGKPICMAYRMPLNLKELSFIEDITTVTFNDIPPHDEP